METKQKGILYCSASKKFMLILIINAVVVELYAMTAMLICRDLSSLYVLIGACCTQVISASIGYFLKSKAENTVGGIVYDSAMSGNAVDDIETPEPEIFENISDFTGVEEDERTD